MIHTEQIWVRDTQETKTSETIKVSFPYYIKRDYYSTTQYYKFNSECDGYIVEVNESSNYQKYLLEYIFNEGNCMEGYTIDYTKSQAELFLKAQKNQECYSVINEQEFNDVFEKYKTFLEEIPSIGLQGPSLKKEKVLNNITRMFESENIPIDLIENGEETIIKSKDSKSAEIIIKSSK